MATTGGCHVVTHKELSLDFAMPNGVGAVTSNVVVGNVKCNDKGNTSMGI